MAKLDSFQKQEFSCTNQSNDNQKNIVKDEKNIVKDEKLMCAYRMFVTHVKKTVKLRTTQHKLIHLFDKMILFLFLLSDNDTQKYINLKTQNVIFQKLRFCFANITVLSISYPSMLIRVKRFYRSKIKQLQEINKQLMLEKFISELCKLDTELYYDSCCFYQELKQWKENVRCCIWVDANSPSFSFANVLKKRLVYRRVHCELVLVRADLKELYNHFCEGSNHDEKNNENNECVIVERNEKTVTIILEDEYWMMNFFNYGEKLQDYFWSQNYQNRILILSLQPQKKASNGNKNPSVFNHDVFRMFLNVQFVGFEKILTTLARFVQGFPPGESR